MPLVGQFGKLRATRRVRASTPPVDLQRAQRRGRGDAVQKDLDADDGRSDCQAVEMPRGSPVLLQYCSSNAPAHRWRRKLIPQPLTNARNPRLF